MKLFQSGANVTLVGNWRNIAAMDYAQFLSMVDHQWFCTFTFKSPTHPETADKAFKHFVNLINRDQFGKRWKKKQEGGMCWVRALEWQKRGVIHYHALISGLRKSSTQVARQAEYLWNEELGNGFARIDLIKGDPMKASAYCSKYVTKGGELDFSDNYANHDQIRLPII